MVGVKHDESIGDAIFLPSSAQWITDTNDNRSHVRTTSAPDPYNAIAYAPSFTACHNQDKPLEYWTNGTTTLILNADADPVVPLSRTISSNCSLKSSVSSNKNLNPGTSRRMGSQHPENRSRHTTQRGALQQQTDPHVVRNSLIAGSVAGVASTLACHPFDVIRTKMQSAAMESALPTGVKTPLSSTSTGPLQQVISQTLRNGGLRALYTGLALPLGAQAIYKSTVFTVNNVTQAFLMDWNTQEHYKTGVFEPYKLNLADRFLCGFIGGGVNAAIFVTPVEYVRNQLISQHSRQAAGQKLNNLATGPLDVIGNTIRSPVGFLGLWKGVNVTVARDSIGCGCFFYAMELSQARFSGPDGEPPTLGVTVFSGAVAGLAYWFAALPLDSVKTWVQSDMADSAVQAVRQSLRERGPRETMKRLLSGFQVAYSRGIPSAAITVTTYSLCYRALKDGME